MAVIKSALEIALEKTQSVEADRGILEASKYRTEGKKAVSRFYSEEGVDLRRLLEQFDRKHAPHVKAGAVEALMASVKLPLDEMSLVQIKKTLKGLFAVVDDAKRLAKLTQQMETFLEEYLQERKRLVAAVDQQYEPLRRQKEEQMSRQMGARVRIDPLQDPDYQKILRQNVAMLEDRYNEVLGRVRQEIWRMTGLQAEE